MKPALLVIDPQNDFFADDNPNLSAFQATVPLINAAIAAFRQHNWPVVFVQHSSSNKPEGSHPWAIYAQFDCRPDDVQLSKTHGNAFWQTELDALLQQQQVTDVVVCGYIAEHCVLSTLRGALERGYRSAILARSIASLNNRYARFTLDISPVFGIDEIISMTNK